MDDDFKTVTNAKGLEIPKYFKDFKKLVEKDLRQNKRLGFEVEKGVYSKFALLDDSVKEELEDKELSDRGRYLKSVDRYKAMLNAFSIAFDSTVKAETRQKAEHDALKALDRIPDKHYALLYDMMEG